MAAVGDSARRAAPIRITGTLALDPDEIEETFVRAAGPGGQHVNTTSTAVQPTTCASGWSGWPGGG